MRFVVGVTGDAGFGYSGMEIETMAKYRMPAIIIIYNNNAWGAWYPQADEVLLAPIHLFQENLRYDKVAEVLGGRGEYVTRPEDFRPALEWDSWARSSLDAFLTTPRIAPCSRHPSPVFKRSWPDMPIEVYFRASITQSLLGMGSNSTSDGAVLGKSAAFLRHQRSRCGASYRPCPRDQTSIKTFANS
jgi:Thiamine pyrophosphate enzyme, C-terminal TPP binding domain